MVLLGVMTGAPLQFWSAAGVVGAEVSTVTESTVGAVAETST